jgi:cell division septation protein DedD
LVPKNEDGEFELILGNRQLLSVFFIVVVLLGVFFTMGYIVGRNSPPDLARKTETRPIVVEPESTPAAPPRASSAQPNLPMPLPVEPKKAAEPEKSKPAPKEVAKEKPPEREKPAPTPPPTPAPAPAPASSSADQPPSGQTFLQLAATTQREADIMVDVLRKKGFKARTAEIPGKAGTFRVLVGPLEADGLNKARADLQGAGFPGNAAIKRTF